MIEALKKTFYKTQMFAIPFISDGEKRNNTNDQNIRMQEAPGWVLHHLKLEISKCR
jgi:hypothetical protein